jgi:hypothetical protein
MVCDNYTAEKVKMVIDQSLKSGGINIPITDDMSSGAGMRKRKLCDGSENLSGKRSISVAMKGSSSFEMKWGHLNRCRGLYGSRKRN